MDFSHKVKDNIYFLKTLAVSLFRRVDDDFLDKLIDDSGRQFCYAHILADNGGETVKVAFILFVGIDFFLFRVYLFTSIPAVPLHTLRTTSKIVHG